VYQQHLHLLTGCKPPQEGFFLTPSSLPQPQKGKMSTIILNEKDIARAINRISHEILERNQGAENIALIGIRTRGVTLSNRLQDKINAIENIEVAAGALDITLYRDDLGAGLQKPELKKTEITFALEGKHVILCDDVLFTGRTIRAAIDALIDFGRPASVQLAVLIDRGHRELPIRPDYVGKNIPTPKSKRVQVFLKEIDDEDKVIIQEQAK
jgi:pyrimidine operon attenuation protein / uracil phosphoribosyltransferase